MNWRLTFTLILLAVFAGTTTYAQLNNPQDILNLLQQIQGGALPGGTTGGGLPPALDPSLFQGMIPTIQFTSLSATPSSPNPGEKFKITAQIPSADANATNFSWTVSGKTRSDLSGRGRHTIELTAGDSGTAIRIDVRATPPQEDPETASLTVFISDLTLIWNADTYIPKWYKGKALASPNSEIVVTAVPRISLGGSVIRPENLIYQWSIDNTQRAQSGVGVNIFRFKAGSFEGNLHWIRVVVEDSQKRIRKTGELLIAPRSPRAIIYASSPLGGIETRSAMLLLPAAKDALIDFLVEPFFFAGKTKTNLSYSWRIAGSAAGGAPENPHILSVDTRGLQSAEIPISITVDDNDMFTAPATKSGTLKIQ